MPVPVPTVSSRFRLSLPQQASSSKRSAQPGSCGPYNYNANIYAESGKGQTTKKVRGEENNRAEDSKPNLPQLRQLLLPAGIRLGPPGSLDVVRSEPP